MMLKMGKIHDPAGSFVIFIYQIFELKLQNPAFLPDRIAMLAKGSVIGNKAFNIIGGHKPPFGQHDFLGQQIQIARIAVDNDGQRVVEKNKAFFGIVGAKRLVKHDIMPVTPTHGSK
ncbi:hypothetical protein SDC9_198982 [bioreactor metagenome]|uniref:Uncharacterized protein n=1 Tax=bioreactor metagenome TaxID=1076179 RepID=A0A645ILJ9_9ZZZZ